MTSSRHWTTSAGVATRARSARLSERKVVRAKWRATRGRCGRSCWPAPRRARGASGDAHDHGGDVLRPAQVVAVHRLEQLVDLAAAEAAAVAVVVHVARAGARRGPAVEQLGPVRGEDADHRADGVPDEARPAAGRAPRRSRGRPRRSRRGGGSAPGPTPRGRSRRRRRGRRGRPGASSSKAGATCRHMPWSQPNPCAKTSGGPSGRPVTVTLFRRQHGHSPRLGGPRHHAGRPGDAPGNGEGPQPSGGAALLRTERGVTARRSRTSASAGRRTCSRRRPSRSPRARTPFRR